MSALAIAVAIAAPIIGGGPDVAVTIEPPVELAPVTLEDVLPEQPHVDLVAVWLEQAREASPVAVTVPTDITMRMEMAPVGVIPKPLPPPPPVVVAPAPVRQSTSTPAAAAPVADHSDAIARARNSANGQLPGDALCGLSFSSGQLRCDAAASLEAAVRAGMPAVELTDTYRSYDQQVAVKAARGSWAARPGTSEHGNGIAIDVPEPARSWLHANGGAFGWYWPEWAQDKNRLEVWHLQYNG